MWRLEHVKQSPNLLLFITTHGEGEESRLGMRQRFCFFVSCSTSLCVAVYGLLLITHLFMWLLNLYILSVSLCTLKSSSIWLSLLL